MAKLANYIKYSDEPTYHLFLSMHNKTFIAFKFSIAYIYRDLQIPSVYLKFKYRNLPIVLNTNEVYNCD